MGDTSIEWTDRTWNPTTGCDQISPGCAHCYAKVQWDRRHKSFIAGGRMAPQYADPFEVVTCHPDRLLDPLTWRAPKRVFVNSVSDLFHQDVPDAFITAVFGVMASCRRHTFQILTKRAARMPVFLERLEAEARRQGFEGHIAEFCAFVASRHYGLDVRDADGLPDDAWPLPNVWLGVSVENQHWYDIRLKELLRTRAAVRFISAEPLLGPLDLRLPTRRDVPALDWVIVGGESGRGARPFDLAWARSIVQQCQDAGLRVFVKQLGANCTDGVLHTGAPGFGGSPTGTLVVHRQLKDRKGGDTEEWPTDLKVREFPGGRQ